MNGSQYVTQPKGTHNMSWEKNDSETNRVLKSCESFIYYNMQRDQRRVLRHLEDPVCCLYFRISFMMKHKQVAWVQDPHKLAALCRPCGLVQDQSFDPKCHSSIRVQLMRKTPHPDFTFVSLWSEWNRDEHSLKLDVGKPSWNITRLSPETTHFIQAVCFGAKTHTG